MTTTRSIQHRLTNPLNRALPVPPVWWCFPAIDGCVEKTGGVFKRIPLRNHKEAVLILTQTAFGSPHSSTHTRKGTTPAGEDQDITVTAARAKRNPGKTKMATYNGKASLLPEHIGSLEKTLMTTQL